MLASLRLLRTSLAGAASLAIGRCQAVGNRANHASLGCASSLLKVDLYPAFRLSPGHKLGERLAEGIIGEWQLVLASL